MRAMIVAGLVGLGLAGAMATSHGVAPATVARFVPEGRVEDVRQIQIRFSEPMVTFGDLRAAPPARVACAAADSAAADPGRNDSAGADNTTADTTTADTTTADTGADAAPPAGQGRWTDARTWVFDFTHDLAGGMRCRVDLRSDLRSLAGAAVTGRQRFSFATGGPSVRALFPQRDTIEERQAFLAVLNLAADPKSVAAEAYCTVEGLGEEIPVDLVAPALRDRMVDAAVKSDWSFGWMLEQMGLDRRAPDPRALARLKARSIAFQCRRPLPPGRAVSVVWPADVESPAGLAAGRQQRFDFTVRTPFTVRLTCSRANRAAACSPIDPLRLSFSERVPVTLAREVRLTGAGYEQAPVVEGKAGETVREIEFPGPHPEAQTYRIVLPRGFRDDSGRPAANASRFPLAVTTDVAPPLVKFSADFGILEAREGGVLPVTVRNVEPVLKGQVGSSAARGQAVRIAGSDAEIYRWIRRVAKAGEEKRDWVKRPGGRAGDDEIAINQTGARSVFAGTPDGTALDLKLPGQGKAFEVVGIPLKSPGFYVVELASPRLGRALLGRDAQRYVATAALVTDMAVHFQWGRSSSLAWVTSLADGKPVSGAEVRITDVCTGSQLWQGRTDSHGRAIATTALGEPAPEGSCDYEGASHPLIVSARHDGDFSFTLTSWNRGIQSWDFDIPFGWQPPQDIAHTIFDRPLFRAGETVSMKHVLRAPVASGFAFVEAPPRDARLRITHIGTYDSIEQPLRFTPAGTAESQWTIPAQAKLGTYSVALVTGDKQAQRERPMGQFRVEEYQLPTMEAVVQGPTTVQVNPRAVDVDLYLGYLSGGAAPMAPVTLRTAVQPRYGATPGYEGYSFGGEAIEEGVTPLTQEAAPPVRDARSIALTLDRQGSARVPIAGLAPVTRASDLVVEMEYADANGEVLTSGTRIALEPAAVRLGLKTDGWLMRADDLRLAVVALDVHNKPVRNQKVRIALYSREVLSVRKRLIGGFYAYDNTQRTRRLDEACTGSTDRLGRVSCTLEPGVSGEIQVEATTTDSAGNVARAVRSVWLAGADEWWFGGDNGDRMDLIPERPDYGPGEVARLQVRMPFRDATVLVSVLREGVLESFVTRLSGKDPVIEVPMKGAYAPNVYVSALAVRGRVSGFRLWLAELARRWDLPWLSRDGARPTATVDLAKPAYRLGMARLKVGWDQHRLDVRVTPDADTYRVRETATIAVQVSPPAGRRLPADAEIAVAAVDEALLQLQPNPSWDLLEAMMGERDLSVSVATAQTQVVGKRHFGRKAVASGGGGGVGAPEARRNFTPLLLWRGRVKLDAQGRARLAVPLVDSLSAFRIVAVAQAGADLFGTGSARIRTVQDLSIFSGVPPLVRDGDRFAARFTLRNSTAAAMTVTATAGVSPAVYRLPPITVTVPAGGAVPVVWNATAPAGVSRLRWTLTAVTGGTHATTDRATVVQSVVPAVPVTTLQAMLVQVNDNGADIAVARPSDALPDRGGLHLTLTPSLTAALAGVKAYMEDYPYSCLEQQLSRAVALEAPALWDSTAKLMPGYLDGDGLLRYFPTDQLRGSDTLTAYALTLADARGWPLPEDVRQRMIAGLTGFVAGRIARESWFEGDLPARKLAAIAALARHGAARPAMLDSLAIAPDDWTTSMLVDWIVILDRLPAVANRATLSAQAETIMRARLEQQGTALALSPVARPGPWWLMRNGDTDMALLLLAKTADPRWRSDLPYLAQGLVQRQSRGHWSTTTANALGTAALQRFATTVEAGPVEGITRATLAGTTRDFAWQTGTPAPAALPWPRGPASLALRHTGAGAPWAVVASRAAVPLTAPLSAGYTISRSVEPVQQKTAGRWTRGDVLRVRLTIDAQSERSWVVLADPIPGGATILGGLGGQSTLIGADGDAVDDGRAWLAFVERGQEAFRAYYEWVPKGRFSIDYMVRLNGNGVFQLPPTRVEAMYAPEAFGARPNAPVTVAAR